MMSARSPASLAAPSRFAFCDNAVVPRAPVLVAACAACAAAACATGPGIEVRSVPLSQAAGNHALLVDADGFAETGFDVGKLARRDHTLALRFAFQHPRAGWGWLAGEGTAGTYTLGKADGAGRLHVNVGGETLESPQPIPAGRWTHVAVTVHGRELLLYVDGDEVARRTVDPARFDASGPLRIGRRADRFAHEHLVGLVDDLWVLDGALGPAAIKALAAGAAPPVDRAFAAYTFEPGAPQPRLAGSARVVPAPLDAPAPRVPPSTTVPLALPFDGPWRVLQGYEGAATHKGYAAFALDFVPAEAGTGASDHHGTGAALDDWPCWDQPVLAPAGGRVVFVAQDQPDMPPGQPEPGGNRVIIEHAAHELSEIVHLQQGSVAVKVGDVVRRGDIVGRCGNSGNATTPHVHWALLWSTEPIMTRPARFAGYEVETAPGVFEPAVAPVPAGGQVARNAAPVAAPPP